MKVKDIAYWIDTTVPLSFQESWDNSGLQIGNPEKEISSALLTLDITEEVVDEAIAENSQMIISHHPLIFTGIKKITGSSQTDRIIIKALRNDIAIYSSHTSLDVFRNGVSRKMAEKLGLSNVTPLAPLRDRLLKLVTFVPVSHIDRVRDAVFGAGAGLIGNYDYCGFTLTGTGSFRAGPDSSPFVGEKGKIHHEEEIRFETIMFSHLKESVVKALRGSHPYEEPAFDIYTLANDTTEEGLGCKGEFAEPVEEKALLEMVSSVFGSKCIRHSGLTGRPVIMTALCGGSGSSLLSDAIRSGADAFITGDVRYHTFMEAGSRILLIDAGHFETEKFATEILYDLIIKKFPKFALRFSNINSNPINYL
ncbi:MAG: Nif3-like dinuclear metal center hexameric protein [Bacteroidales bacterium]|nr:Nif3-like dinuclear metal center hexameric protein [Bacteroidales bacterium]